MSCSQWYWWYDDITIHQASLCWSNSSILGTEMQRLQDNVWSQICDLTFINKHSINLCHSEGPLHHENPSADTTKRSHFWPRSYATWRDGSLAFCGYGQGMLVAAEDGGLVKILVGVQCKSNGSYYLNPSKPHWMLHKTIRGCVVRVCRRGVLVSLCKFVNEYPPPNTLLTPACCWSQLEWKHCKLFAMHLLLLLAAATVSYPAC